MNGYIAIIVLAADTGSRRLQFRVRAASNAEARDKINKHMMVTYGPAAGWHWAAEPMRTRS